MKVDCLIIGAGPIGLTCAIAAKKAGLSNLIVDRGTLVNSIYHYPANMTFFSTSDRLEIGEVPFISNSPKPTRSEALEYYRRVTLAWDLKVNLYEESQEPFQAKALRPRVSAGLNSKHMFFSRTMRDFCIHMFIRVSGFAAVFLE